VDVAGADAVAMAHVLHYKQVSLDTLRRYLTERGIEVAVHDTAAPL